MQTTAKKILPHHHYQKQSLRVIKPKKKGKVQKARSTLFPFLMALAFVVTALVLLNMAQRVLISQYSIQNEKLKSKLLQEEESKEELFAKKLVLESSQRIEEIARKKLGMIDPPSVEYLIYPDKESADQDSSQLVLTSKKGKDKNKRD